ncbi:MAG: 16S rRNA (guanine(527)-N(7))-methyltransferase RsmG [Rhodocyclaceae bacterium]|nr:16S rRNA (guanine(527)-N(7))-methyltransferase RsmG [Rhodocyclaceae bacterium]
MNLADGIAALDLDLSAGAADKLSAYLALLAKWNKVYNLTAIRDPDAMVTHHLLDSLAVLPILEKSAPGRPKPTPADCPLRGWGAASRGCERGGAIKSALAERRAFSLADIGSGAGLPGIVLAIARPDWSITSIEAVDKKAAFQRQVKIELGLANVSIHCGRVEDVKGTFSAVIARAFASLGDFIRLAGHLSPCLWALKGAYPADEIAALPAAWRVSASHELHVPGLEAQRHLLQLEKI